MDSPNLKLLACQVNIPKMQTKLHRDAHLRLSAIKVQSKLKNQKVDLVVLPELSSLDYSRETFNVLKDLAEPLDGPSFECWKKVALQCNCYVSYSFARRFNEKYFITVAIVNNKGKLIGYYDKIHIAQFGASMEKEFFVRGNHLFSFDLKGFKIAPIICYDIRIPELSRVLTLDHKVDLILHCGAYARDVSFYTWHSFVITRALENQIFFLSLNRAGKNFGNSLFSKPWIDANNPPKNFSEYGEDFCIIELEKKELNTIRKKYTFLGDRLKSYKI